MTEGDRDELSLVVIHRRLLLDRGTDGRIDRRKKDSEEDRGDETRRVHANTCYEQQVRPFPLLRPTYTTIPLLGR